MDIKDKLKNLHSINMLIKSLERLLKCDREEFKNFPELLEGLEQDSLQEIAKLKRQKLEVESLINRLDNELQRKVLIEHYSHGYKWDKVADDLGYSKAYLSKVHSKALTKKCSMCSIEKRLNEFYENSTKADHRNGICKDCQKKVNQKNK